MNTATTIVATLLLTTATVLAATPARAADSKIYPGEMCNPSVDDSQVAHFWGRLKNNSGVTRNFECPVVRDQIDEPITVSDAWVINQNPNQNLSCTIGMLLPLSGGTNGASGYFSTRSTAVVGSSPQLLPPFGGLGHLVGGYAVMICSVPGLFGGQQSGVVSYHINEAS